MHGLWHRQTCIQHVYTQVHTHITTKGNGDMNLKRTRYQDSLVGLEGEKGRKKGYNFITISTMKIVSKNSFYKVLFYFLCSIL